MKHTDDEYNEKIRRIETILYGKLPDDDSRYEILRLLTEDECDDIDSPDDIEIIFACKPRADKIH